MNNQLTKRLAEMGVTTEEVSASKIVVRSIHDAVGDIAIEFDENEITVRLGRYYHTHFDNQDDSESELDNITKFVSDFVTGHSILTIHRRKSKVVTARLDNTLSGTSSVVMHPRSEQSKWSRMTSVFQKNRESAQSYKWSGPVPLFLPKQSEDETKLQNLAEAASNLTADDMKELVRLFEQKYSAKNRED